MPDSPFVDWLAELPVASALPRIVEASRGGAVVVTAPPGSGKTMLVPAAVLDDLPAGQKVALIQPRRLAARAVARQIARLRGSRVGGEVGYLVRFDACVSRETRLVVETTGIMLRRLLDDISLEGIGAVVLDEFHERTIEMDLVLGLLLRVRQTLRPDLRIVVMSATLAAEPVAKLLGDCPIVHAEGRRFPVSVRYQRRGEQRELPDLVAATVPEALRDTDGHLLVFLPGVGEIMRCEAALASLADRQGFALLKLFGDLPPEEQDRALLDTGQRKIILSTNVAETSLTIPGVTAVIDSGQVRQLRVAPATGLPRLELTPISQASAEQRAGRAGRTAPGVCWRLWEEASHRHRPEADIPEALRSDLAEPLLQLLVLGESEEFPWLDPPPSEALENARRLLHMLGAIDAENRVTPLGKELSRLPAHPRLGRLLLAGAHHGVLRETSIAAALLSERDPFRTADQGRRGPRDHQSVRTRSDVVDRVVALQAFHGGMRLADPALELHHGGARNVLRSAEQLYRLVDRELAPRSETPELSLMQALLEAFPDRLAKLRGGTQDRATMVGGRGVRLDGGSRVRGETLLLAIDLNDAGGEARARSASAVEREWLPEELLETRDELFYNPTRGQVEARSRTYWSDLLLEETPVAISDRVAAGEILAREARPQLDRFLPPSDSAAGSFLARVRWLAESLPELELPRFDAEELAAMLPEVCIGLRSLDDIRTADWLSRLQQEVGYERIAEIERLAPREFELTNGNRHPLTYEPGRPPMLAVKIQELFGVRETPRIGGGRVAVLLHLLGPNRRPQQVTADLASFWANTYPEVKKELRRRYPKHAWPDDPLAVQATRSGLKRDMKE
ncbi:ATP-dependent helicase HrpB [Lacipirellula parvula]|uniref:ATP-dependent helicase HrpB n=1 Tax=Lacipirellula parvula TaxID=2650471 RepID=A0A5K7XMD4_9BACT|nr:ATP-dependent helicase HrpB [Lacipirellula parvula]BBO35743.1 ATP-dependent helicase HrpB [Lacipirellula parvula]